MKYIAEVDDLDFPVEIIDDQHVRFGEEILEVNLAEVSGVPLYTLIVNNESFEGYVYPDEDGWQVLLQGQFYQVRVEDEREKRLRTAGETLPRVQVQNLCLRLPCPAWWWMYWWWKASLWRKARPSSSWNQ